MITLAALVLTAVLTVYIIAVFIKEDRK